jgi:predicted ATPase
MPTPTVETLKSNLPAQPTPFVGRKAELAELDRLLSDPDVRLVTVLGAGGMGKTRLALEAAQAHVGGFEHGVYLVSLAPLRSAENLVPAVADAIGLAFYPGAEPRQHLLGFLRCKRMLLVLDNFEHLLDGVDIAAEILKTARDVKLLATSRARLNVQGEHRFHITGMDFPEPMMEASTEMPKDALEYSAVKLFVQATKRAQPGFKLRADDLGYVARICRLVGGMPLGILLAAAWVEMLTPKEIAAEIAQSLDFLETDLSDVPERQRSMRAVFDHSWNLLAARQRDVMQALSVFRGGFTRQAAQRVTGVTLRELMSLVNKSLLHRSLSGRYEIHELLRQYAAEKLSQSPDAEREVHDRHTAYYATALQVWAADLRGPRQMAALGETDADIDNVRAAWDWAVKREQVERLDRAIDGLCRFYLWRGRYREGLTACQRTARKLDAPVSTNGRRVLAKALAWQGCFAGNLGDVAHANQLRRRGLDILGSLAASGHDTRAERAAVLLDQMWGEMHSDLGQAKQLGEQSLALYQGTGDRLGMAVALGDLGWVAVHLRDWDEAKKLFQESVTILREYNNPRETAKSLQGLGFAVLALGQLEEAERLALENIAICREMGDWHSLRVSRRLLSAALSERGQWEQVYAMQKENLAFFEDIGDYKHANFAMMFMSSAKMHLGSYDQARTLAETALVRSEEAKDQEGIETHCLLLARLAVAEGAYSEAQERLHKSIAARREMGRQADSGELLTILSYAALGLGLLPQAKQHLRGALRLASECKNLSGRLEPLIATALLLINERKVEFAVELYALAKRYSYVAHSCWLENVAGKHIAAMAAPLPPAVIAAAQERGRARDLRTTVDELLAELEG